MALTTNYDLYYTETNDDPAFINWRNELAGPNGNMVKIDAALASVLPSQSGNNGKFLTTNGSATSWATVDALPSQSGNSGKYLTTNGSAASWANAPEEVFIAEYGVTTYADVYAAYQAGKPVLLRYQWPDSQNPSGLLLVANSYINSVSGEIDFNFSTIVASDNSDKGSAIILINLQNQGVNSWAEPMFTTTVPTNHSSIATTYGLGSYSVYGHLKLSDSTSSTSGTSGGIAATPAAVKAAYDLANGKDSLPSQSGNSGKFLTTNGSAASWATVDALPSQTGNNGKVLGTNGTTASWVDAQGASVTINTWALSSP